MDDDYKIAQLEWENARLKRELDIANTDNFRFRETISHLNCYGRQTCPHAAIADRSMARDNEF
jgi:hypothetical protein